MGKIFDALEKADRDYSKTLPVSKKAFGAKDDNKDKVVPLVNSNKYLIDRKLDPNLVTFHAPQSAEAERFKVLRTNLLFPAKGKVPKTILVTSPLPGDGKSLVSANLAVSIAKGVEEYVLLIDGDIRKPSIHTIFGYHQVNGLGDYLKAENDLPKYLLKTPIPKLTLLPGGKPPANPTELLSSKKMQKLIEEVSIRYDDRYIIIDSPPPSMAAETSVIEKMVDGVIIVVRYGKTPRKAVTDLVEQIDKEKLLGIVFNYSDRALKKYYGHGKAYYRKDSNRSE